MAVDDNNINIKECDIFDNSHNNTVDLDWNTSRLCRQVLMQIHPILNIKSCMHSHGKLVVKLDREVDIVDGILFDTGALGANYVSKRFVEQYKEYLKKDISNVNNMIQLANKENIIKVTEQANIILRFQGISKTYTYTGQFLVIDMENDFIIGLPAIVGDLYDYFVELLAAARSHQEQQYHHVHSLQRILSLDTHNALLLETGQLREPWQYPVTATAPEELLTPEPVNFSYALHFLELTHEDAVKEYEAMLDDRVSSEMKESTNVIHLLKVKGVKVFVPSNWEGINGIPPLELKWKPGLPERVKPKARPINPNIYDAARTEVNRLLGYFYRKSRSSIASPLVFAPKATKPFIRTCGDYVYINKFIETLLHT